MFPQFAQLQYFESFNCSGEELISESEKKISILSLEMTRETKLFQIFIKFKVIKKIHLGTPETTNTQRYLEE